MSTEIKVTKNNLTSVACRIAGMLTYCDALSVKVSDWKDTRSLASNRKMWSCLSDIASQVKWTVNGVVTLISAEDWKDILSASLKREGRIAAGIDGGFVMLGQRTSKMKVQEMCDLIEVIYAFGASNDIKWSEPIPPEYLEFSNRKEANR